MQDFNNTLYIIIYLGNNYHFTLIFMQYLGIT